MAEFGSYMLRNILCLVSRVESRDDPQVPEKGKDCASRIPYYAAYYTLGQDMGFGHCGISTLLFLSYRNARNRTACDTSSHHDKTMQLPGMPTSALS